MQTLICISGRIRTTSTRPTTATMRSPPLPGRIPMVRILLGSAHHRITPPTPHRPALPVPKRALDERAQGPPKEAFAVASSGFTRVVVCSLLEAPGERLPLRSRSGRRQKPSDLASGLPSSSPPTISRAVRNEPVARGHRLPGSSPLERVDRHPGS